MRHATPHIPFIAAVLPVIAGCAAAAAGVGSVDPSVMAEAAVPTSFPAGTVANAAAHQAAGFALLYENGPISREEYAARRAALAEAMEEDGVFVAFGFVASGSDYSQTSTFRYLTGVVEPGAGLIMVKKDGRVDEILFVQPRDPARELWDGVRLGAERAQTLTGIPTLTNDRFSSTLDSLVSEHATLYSLVTLFPDGPRDRVLTREQQMLQRAVDAGAGTRVVSLNQQLQQLRARKSKTELDMIRRAVHVSALAHREAIRSVEPGMNEFEIQGLIEYFFRRHGADGPAYASIVGSGPNSSTLHYRTADRFMEEGEVLLMDVGASYRGYAADITRTIPVGYRFTPEQRALYEVVLEAQKAAESRVVPGGRWATVNAAADSVIAAGLARLGLIDSPDATYVCASPQNDNRCLQYRLFYMHSLGHGVGLDVHDPDISLLDSFQEGSAFTIEPGVYVRSDVFTYLRESPENTAMANRLRPQVERFRDTGVRIEDVYVIGENGLERVSAEVPREPDEIERLRAERGLGQESRRPDVVDWYRATDGR